MIDFTALLYSPNYTIFGVEAVITPASFGLPVTVTAIDKTSGVEVGNNMDVATIRPAAVVRASEIAEAGLTRADLRRAALTMNGKTWRIETSMPKPSPNGEGDGELMLILIEDA